MEYKSPHKIVKGVFLLSLNYNLTVYNMGTWIVLEKLEFYTCFVD